jgi:hypothetical protein
MVAQALALATFTVWVGIVLFHGFHLVTDLHGLPGNLAVLVDWLVIILCVPTYLRSKKPPLALKIAAWTLTVLVAVGVAPYIFGGLENVLHLSCFGGSVDCILGLRFELWVPLFLIGFWPIVVALPILILVGLRQASRK